MIILYIIEKLLNMCQNISYLY